MDNEEIWKDIKNSEGLYQVSNLGRVRSLNHRNRLGYIKVMSPYISSSNYYHLRIRKHGHIIRSVDVHRLVAETFIPNPNNLPQVNHKNENKLDNRVENLEWCDAKYNVNYGTCVDRITRTHIEKFGKPVKCVETGECFRSVMEAAKKYNYNQGNISNACVNRNCTYTAHGYHWKFITLEEYNAQKNKTN